MRVLVAGATGTLGRHVVRELGASGHDVFGLTRSWRNRDLLATLGANMICADLLDGPSLESAFRASAPDAVIALLSARPPRGLTRLREFGPTIELWESGARNLLAVTRARGIEQVIFGSIVFAYGYGDVALDSVDESLAAEAGFHLAGQRRVLRALREMERAALGLFPHPPTRGVVLRYGFLYGLDVPSTHHVRNRLAARRLRIPADAGGVLSWVEAGDAATGTVAALDRARPGQIYNVVDDVPLSFGAYARALARSQGSPPPKAVPAPIARILRPHAASFISHTKLAVTNAKAREELQWRPRFASVEEWLADNSVTRPTREPAPRPAAAQMPEVVQRMAGRTLP
jgi:nucleoside-diphosphate-sugar epimerase